MDIITGSIEPPLVMEVVPIRHFLYVHVAGRARLYIVGNKMFIDTGAGVLLLVAGVG